MDMSPDELRRFDTASRRLAEHGRQHGGEQLDHDVGPGPKIAQPRAHRLPGAARTGLDAARRPGRAASPSASGVVSGGGKTVTYGQLLGGQAVQLHVPASTTALDRRVSAPAKPVSAYTTSSGQARTPVAADRHPGEGQRHLHLHPERPRPRDAARPDRPAARQGAYRYDSDARSASTPSSIATSRTLRSFRSSNFLGVVAPKEYDAIQAAAQLKVVWKTHPILPGSGNLWEHMPHARRAGQIAADDLDQHRQRRRRARLGREDGQRDLPSTTTRAHARSARSCAVADVNPTRRDRSTATPRTSTSLVPISSTCSTLPGNSGPGASSTRDRAPSATAPSHSTPPRRQRSCRRRVGVPVRVQFMRWDEHGWGTTAPASLPTSGRASTPTARSLPSTPTFWTHGSASRSPERTRELAAQGAGPSADRSGPPWSRRNSGGIYATSTRTSATPTSCRRSTAEHGKGSTCGRRWTLVAAGSPTSMIDELAYAANMDPVAFRLQNIGTGRTATSADRADLRLSPCSTVAEISGWKPRVANSVKQTGNIVTGRGVAIGSDHTAIYRGCRRYPVNKKTGKITRHAPLRGPGRRAHHQPRPGREPDVRRRDPGHEPRAVRESVQQDQSPASTGSPIRSCASGTARRSRSRRPAHRSAPRSARASRHARSPAAIANAFFDATGVRIRQPPMTPGLVRGTLQSAGVA